MLGFLHVMKSNDVGMAIGLKDGDFQIEIVEDFFGEFLRASGDGLDGNYFDGGAGIFGVIARIALVWSDSFVYVGKGAGSQFFLQDVTCCYFYGVRGILRSGVIRVYYLGGSRGRGGNGGCQLLVLVAHCCLVWDNLMIHYCTT